MEERYTRIHRYIRSDFGFAGFDGKIFTYMLACFFISILATNSLWQMIATIGFGVWSGFRLQELKDAKLKGALRQILYYFGFLDAAKNLKRIPPSYIKEFIG